MFSATSKPALDHLKSGNGDAAPITRSGPSPFDRAAAPETGVSVIGTDLTLLGEKISIVSQNKLQVDGDVRGNVHGKQVVITKEGSVVGMVCAEKIEVFGGVRGSIRAVTVKLHDTAQVEGDIMHHTLAISEGAKFDGRVRRSTEPQELMPILDPEVIATRPHDSDAMVD